MEEFTINKAYAEKYNKWRQKEELQKLKDKYGDINDEETESSSSESEDEDAEALTSQIEKDWLLTLSALKSKDPKIYQKDVQFYQTEENTDGKKIVKKEKQKPVFLKDYQRKVILEKEGHLSEESDNEDEGNEDIKPGYYEEQEQIKKSFKSALLDSDEESSDSDLLTKRSKSKQEKDKEEEEYSEWLRGQKKNIKDEQKVGIELESLKSYWNDPKLDEGEKFLRDYILNKQYLDKDSDRIPTFDEIVDEGEGFSEEESILDKQEEFERKYNFRFEEPDQEFIKSYPRTIVETVRRKDSKRAEKRKEIKERKKQEKEKRKEELKQLKNLKKKEISDKISKLKEISGNPSLEFTEEDLEDDFDPQKHDEMMKKYFKDDYYEMETEDQKPVFSDDEDLDIADWDNWQGEKDVDDDNYGDTEEYEYEGQNFNMDADYDPDQDQTTKRGKKKKSVFARALNKKKPVFDPGQKTFEEYFDEYYKLDYEDIIGDTPCRFKYRGVTANNFGLSVDEVLKCREKELNAWVSVKKMSQYRTEEEEAVDVKIYRNKANNETKKLRILTSLQEQQQQRKEENIQSTKKDKKQKGKKQTKAKPSHTVTSAEDNITEQKEQKDFDKSHDSSHDVQNDQLNFETNQSSKHKASKVEGTPKKRKVIQSDVYSPSIKKQVSLQNPMSCDKKRKKKKKVSENTDSANKNESSYKQEESILGSKVIGVSDSSVVKEKLTEKLDSTKERKAPKEQENITVSSKLIGVKDNGGVKKKRKKKKKGKPVMTDERLLAYGINPKKFKYMKFTKLKEGKTVSADG